MGRAGVAPTGSQSSSGLQPDHALYASIDPSGRRASHPRPTGWEPVALLLSYYRMREAGEGIRTLDLNLGKVALYS